MMWTEGWNDEQVETSIPQINYVLREYTPHKLLIYLLLS